MSRFSLGIFLSLVILMFITAYNYTPQKVEGNTCQIGAVCNKPDCCNKVKSEEVKKQCGSSCAGSCCSKT
jgi:hypothetical protein